MLVQWLPPSPNQKTLTERTSQMGVGMYGYSLKKIQEKARKRGLTTDEYISYLRYKRTMRKNKTKEK